MIAPRRVCEEQPVEPYRIRSLERIHLLSPSARRQALERAGYNLFRLKAREVFIDLLTDSGTGAMSDRQWGAIHRADESYAGSESYERFCAVVQQVTGFPQIIPVHQGRAAERILFEAMLSPGATVVSNTLFDTTRANVERLGAVGVDLPCSSSKRSDAQYPFQGNIDLDRLEQLLSQRPVKLVILTATNNARGGHPLSLSNAAAAAELCRTHRVPLFLDAARFAENAGLLAARDPACRGRPASDLAKDLFALTDGCLMSAKKNGLAHMGGFVAMRDEALAERCRENLVITEGFETYGGLAGRDLDAIAVGLEEALDDAVLEHRLAQVAHFHEQLEGAGVPVVSPAGGHAVYVDAAAMLPHLPAHQFPGHALACALYAAAGVRACEVGTLMFPDRPPGAPELMRLAVPWRTYTGAQLQYVARALRELAEEPREVRGFRLVNAPSALRHFRAVLAPA